MWLFTIEFYDLSLDTAAVTMQNSACGSIGLDGVDHGEPVGSLGCITGIEESFPSCVLPKTSDETIPLIVPIHV